MPELTDGEIARALDALNNNFGRINEKLDKFAETQAEQATALATLAERSKVDRERHHELRDHLNRVIGGLQVEQIKQSEALATKADKSDLDAASEKTDKIEGKINMATGAAIAGGATGTGSLVSQIAQLFQGGGG